LEQKVTGTEGVAVDVEAYQGSEAGATELGGSHWISIAAANVLPKMALYQALRLLRSYELETVRCHLDVVDDRENGSVAMVSPFRQTRWQDRWDQPGAWDGVMKDLRRIKWADERVYEL
ncbi:unnamed protein product, partial [Hapterophycus canaliculatus]